MDLIKIALEKIAEDNNYNPLEIGAAILESLGYQVRFWGGIYEKSLTVEVADKDKILCEFWIGRSNEW